MGESTLRAESPFFLVDDGAVDVGRTVTLTGDDLIAKAYETAPARADRAWGDAADLLTAALPVAVKKWGNPLIVDDWTAIVKGAGPDVGFLFSAPGGVEVTVDKIADTLRMHGVGHHWVIDAREVIEKAEGAWRWEISALPGRVFLSSFEPPRSGVHGVVGPDGAARPERVARMRALRKDAVGEQRLVTGIVLEPETVDAQGDIYDADEVARAAHGWMEDYQNLGHMHRVLVNSGVRPVESYTCPIDCEIGGQPVKEGTWILVVHVLSDAIWEQVKAGDLTGFSIGGYAQRVPAQVVPE